MRLHHTNTGENLYEGSPAEAGQAIRPFKIKLYTDETKRFYHLNGSNGVHRSILQQNNGSQ
jgi:hypothetical protein